MPRVGIVGSRSNPHARYVADAVEREGARVAWVETRKVPDHVRLSWEDGRVTCEGSALDEVGAFYVKAVHQSLPSIDPLALPHRNFRRWQDRYAAERERQSFLGSLLRVIARSGRAVVNPVETFDVHFLKAFQIAELLAEGLPVPATLATSDPDAVLAFCERHPAAIVKPLSGGAPTRRIGPADLSPERVRLVRNAPVLLQEEIPGDEVRAYLLDNRPLAAFGIDMTGVVDSRSVLDRARPVELPEATWALCARAAKRLGLIFTAVDLRFRTDGSACLLELNPTPAIAFHDDPHEGRVVAALARFLVEKAREHA